MNCGWAKCINYIKHNEFGLFLHIKKKFKNGLSIGLKRQQMLTCS